MAWVLEHCPANEEWTKRFDTKVEAVAELFQHICSECLTGEIKYVDPDEPSGFGIEKRKKPDPASARDLLSTPCGCEYELYEE